MAGKTKDTGAATGDGGGVEIVADGVGELAEVEAVLADLEAAVETLRDLFDLFEFERLAPLLERETSAEETAQGVAASLRGEDAGAEPDDADGDAPVTAADRVEAAVVAVSGICARMDSIVDRIAY